MLARLEALENDNAGFETVQVDDDDEASLDDDDQGHKFYSFFSIQAFIKQTPSESHFLPTYYIKNHADCHF